LIDANFGDYNTGYIQYLFQAKNVDVFCHEDIELTRSEAYEACPGCIETMNI